MKAKNFIHKISLNEIDESIHQKFIRFSLGEFVRESILIKKTAKALQVQTGAEYAVDLMLMCTELLADENPTLTGDGVITSSKKNLNSEIEAAGFNVKASRGKKYTVTFELTAKEFKEALEKMTDYFVLVKFTVPDVMLKMKMSLPKPGSISEKFATLKVDNKYAEAVAKNFLFDIAEGFDVTKFKSAEVKQTFFIEDVEIPKEYQDDFALARLHAKKKGKIKRTVIVDGEEKKSYEIEFLA
jgi:hypothetical protein